MTFQPPAGLARIQAITEEQRLLAARAQTAAAGSPTGYALQQIRGLCGQMRRGLDELERLLPAYAPLEREAVGAGEALGEDGEAGDALDQRLRPVRESFRVVQVSPTRWRIGRFRGAVLQDYADQGVSFLSEEAAVLVLQAMDLPGVIAEGWVRGAYTRSRLVGEAA